MVKTYYKNEHGARLPTLFLDPAGTKNLQYSAEQLGKTVVKEEASSLSRLFENGLKKDTIYHTACDEKTLYEKVHELQAVQTFFRLGVNLPSENTQLLEQLLPHNVSIVLASDRTDMQWHDHFQRSQQFVFYIDPWFQPHLVERYRELHEEREEKIRELHLNMEKLSTVLSDAELRIFEKIVEGKSNRRIAEESFLAVATVNNHVSHLTRKMGANDRTHTIKRAIEKDWVRIS
ncbi:response regulator transcription factor [Salibacterium sp. K-3]